VDFSSLVWTNPAPATGNDTLAVYSNKSGESADNAIEQTGTGSWQKISSGWPGVGEMDLFIFPFVSTDISCGLLPLKLLQFNAERKGKDVVVNWTVANEYDMLNYEVERADDNLTFKKVASVNAVNATSYTYAVTDKNVTGGTSGKVTYRLKQINKDGSFTYSSYVVINIGEGFTITFENPVHNSLKLHVSSSAPQKIAVRMFDMQGKFVGIQQEALVDAGNQIINLNGSASLSPGVYILDVLINNEHKHYKVVKH
ncbi:MAG: T9SS type A sorting domain-containing protein, partial [Ilyomonas sp.]